MNTRFVLGQEHYIPSYDVSRPAFGLLHQTEEVRIVFDLGTPVVAQEVVTAETASNFSQEIFDVCDVAEFIANRLVDLVRSGQIRRNQFNGQWFWLG